MKRTTSRIVYSPGDLIRYFTSPFASWMDRYELENPGEVTPDDETEEQRLIVETGRRHEQDVLGRFRGDAAGLVEIDAYDAHSGEATLAAVGRGAEVIYQAALADDRFEGYADFLIRDDAGRYQVWDTKLARSPKPNYAIQLCCYSEMLAATTGQAMPERFGIILGTAADGKGAERVEFWVEDFIHYYRHIRASFLAMQDGFIGRMDDRPEPVAGVDHGRWTSHAEQFFADTDHLARVAGISGGQIKKLRAGGINTVAELAGSSGARVPKLAAETLEKLAEQARLQNETLADRRLDPNARARYELLERDDGEAAGLAALPAADAGDVFFDMEGYPLMPGGLEYLFGAATVNEATGETEFHDWWAHDRSNERLAFEGFINWVHERWLRHPAMHIYHYAPYEVTAVRRLSTFHDTRQDEVDDLLRNDVFVDLYRIVRQSIRLGEESYSIKKVERQYRDARETDVATGAESIVQYARWIESGEPREWSSSAILKNIRDYNEDDCVSTLGLYRWLRGLADEHGIQPQAASGGEPEISAELNAAKPEIAARLEIVRRLRKREDAVSHVLGDLVDFHRREAKPLWWRKFDRAAATPEQLCDDAGCVSEVTAVGEPWPEKQSLLKAYTFDPTQECKLGAGERSQVMFCHNTQAKLILVAIDVRQGTLTLKVGKKTLDDKFGGRFPQRGSLIPDEFVNPEPIPTALAVVAEAHLADQLPAPARALLERTAPAGLAAAEGSVSDRAIAITSVMDGGCLVIQGPPGTGKTYTAARVINALVRSGKRVGVCSNGHKAIVNLLCGCGDAIRESGAELRGLKAGGEDTGKLFDDNPGFGFIKTNKDAYDAYAGGVIGGTAWLFARDEWSGGLDYLFIDEAGQVSLANVVAMSRSARNLVLLGDQMQLEQPVQGSHPGDAGMSGLQYALKDTEASRADLPIFHSVVPDDYGLFLGESWRMHPAICSFISDSIYEGLLRSQENCARQSVDVPAAAAALISKQSGIVFSGVEHDGNVQQSDEEAERVRAVFEELIGREYTDAEGGTRPLALNDFLFISPYNAQVRALQSILPAGARIGSVDKFQGQEAPVCILSLCSSYGEYGSRGLGFILDRNRVNVAISRAQCLAIVVADPRIANTRVNSIDNMRLLNLYCKLISV